MLESLEGKRGQVRAKPPLPAIQGLFGKPTVINNVLSFASTPWILTDGAKAYADYGAGRSRGTQPFQLAGDILRGGLVELAFGVTIRELIQDFGGGTRSGRPFAPCRSAARSAPISPMPARYAARLRGDAGEQGHARARRPRRVQRQRRSRQAGALRLRVLRQGKLRQVHAMPRRLERGVETVEKIIAGRNAEANIALLRDLCETMTDCSLCALGGLTPLPVMSALDHFPEDFRPRVNIRAAE